MISGGLLGLIKYCRCVVLQSHILFKQLVICAIGSLLLGGVV
jgi:hypothetical protein